MAAALQRLRVRALVVDDSESNLAMLARALRGLGMAVETAVNGQEAVDAAAARQGTPQAFTLITCDKTMPVLSGVGAVRRLRAAPTSFAGVIVGITGDAAAADRAEFEAAGVDAMLTKPVSRAELVRALYPLLVDAPPRSASAVAASELLSPAESP
jgi:CheY-like chemotaxis protein